MLKNDFAIAARRFSTLLGLFQNAAAARNSVVPEVLPQKDAAQKLREVSSQRARILFVELQEAGNITRLSHERVSLMLRYRSAEADPDGRICADLIADDLNCAAKTDSYATNVMLSLGSYEPLTQEQQDDLKRRINSSLIETRRLVQGCMGPVLTDKEVEVFHNGYEQPENPAEAFCLKTQSLICTTLKLADVTGNRIENTMDYVDCIDRIIVPAFPDHAEGMKAQADEMMAEVQGSLQWMHDLIVRARAYEGQYKVIPLRGPGF